MKLLDLQRRLADHLDQLIDGSQPLPPPHPQRFASPIPGFMRLLVAKNVAHIIRETWERGRAEPDWDAARHLLFKFGSYVLRRYDRSCETDDFIIDLEIVAEAVVFTMRREPKWLKSKAGISYALRRWAEWRRHLENAERQDHDEPVWVSDFEIFKKFDVVELTNARQIYTEGRALGHCMASSYNFASLQKHSNPSGAEAFESLTYAVKLRNRDVRIFSLRNDLGEICLTLTYDPRAKKVLHFQGGTNQEWGVWTCLMVRALSTSLEIKSVDTYRSCDRFCPFSRPGERFCATLEFLPRP